ncbi:MAG TPA: hypothetical protein VIL04_09640 [Solirubrobacterales bacterium]
MPGLRSVIAALICGCLMVAPAACGPSGDDESTIPAEEGRALLERLDAIEAAVNEGSCDTARTEAESLFQDIETLPEEVSEDDREALRRAARNLVELTREQCDEPETGPTGEAEVLPPEETLTEPAPETTEPPETEPENDEGGRGPNKPDRGGPDRGNGPPGNGPGGNNQGPGGPGQGDGPPGGGGPGGGSESGGIGTGG